MEFVYPMVDEVLIYLQVSLGWLDFVVAAEVDEQPVVQLEPVVGTSVAGE